MDPEFPNEPEPNEPVGAVPESAWLTPAKLPAAPGVVSGIPAMYDLRPLTTGEVLDRTFSVYRSRFWLFAGIAAVSGAMETLAAGSQMVLQHSAFRVGVRQPAPATMGEVFHFGTTFVVMLVAYLLFFLATSLTQAATAFAVSEVYLGRPTTIRESFRATIKRWLAYIGVGLWQLWSFIWLPLLIMLPAFVLTALKVPSLAIIGGILIFLGVFVGGVCGFILGLRNTLAIPATVIERLKVRATMRRSKVLTAGTKGRIFLVMLISACLYMVVGVLQAPLSMFVLFALAKGKEAVAAQAGMLVIGFLGHSVVTPVAMIGFTLVYFDQRVRKEAFDIAVLLGEEQMVAAGAPVVETTAAEVESAGAVDDDGGV